MWNLNANEIFFLFFFQLQKDEMELEHLATLERLRQSQRQDYLKVGTIAANKPTQLTRTCI